VAAARAQVKQAEADLERLLNPVTASELAEAEAMARQAQSQLDLLLAGARAADVDAAAAGADEARAALQQAEAALADTELCAPFAGTVAALYVELGEPAGAGMPVVELADMSAWQVETNDLTELDVARVQEGAAVVLTFDALPGLEIPGRVVRIKPIGIESLGDMTYTVVLQPEGTDPRLRWNMTVVVTFP